MSKATEDDFDPAAEIEAKRATRKAARGKDRRLQYAIDLAELDKHEQAHGDGAVASLAIDRDNLPCLVIVRCANDAEVKRFRDRTRADKNGNAPAPEPAAEQVGSCCLLYPTPEVFAQMCQAVSGLHAQAGVAALDLAAAKSHEQGKG